jgi:signal transduction histidine kinase
MTKRDYVDLPAQKEEIDRLRTELREQTQLADMGELAGQVTHKFNNFLNSLLLKVALLEAELSEHVAAKFADTKHDAKKMAEIIKQVHEFQRREPLIEVLDLNALIRKIAGSVAWSAAGLSIQLELSSGAPLISGSPVDFQRLVSFLLRNRLIASARDASTPAGRTLLLRTDVKEKVLFSLEDDKCSVSSSLLANLFDGEARDAGGEFRLELAACKAIVRRNQGRIHAKTTAGGGLLIDMEFPLA